jgi:hypothetical protein
MDFTTFVRKPFLVQAVEVTKDNIEELAPLVGTLQTKDDGTPFIKVDHKKVPNIYRVFPGFWMTKMETEKPDQPNIRCYSRKVFRDQFAEADEQILDWVNFLNGVDIPVAADAAT